MKVSGAAAVAVVTAAHLRRLWWRARRSAGKRQAPRLAEDTDVLRIGYSKKKVPADIDHIVIGSGLSGLYVAAVLSKLGRRVLVLEQHYVAGGCTHTFKDKGFEFDTGVHYLGQGTMLTAMMDFAAGRQGAFRMQRIGMEDDSNVYNEIRIGKDTFHFRPGKENFIRDLVAGFPDEEAAIRRFFREVIYAMAAMGLAGSKQLMPEFMWTALLSLPGPVSWLANRYIRRTFVSILEECGIKNQQLVSVLSAECGDHGVIPEEAPFVMQAAVLFSYIWEGAYYPVGGSDAFAEALVPAVLDAGGAVFVRAPVTKIITENAKAVGVEVKGTDVYRAKYSVISAAGAEVTYRKLLDRVELEKLGVVPKSLVATEGKGTAHHIYGFIGLEGTSEELGLPQHNVWSFSTAGCSDTPSLSSAWKAVTSPKQVPKFLESDEAAAEAELPFFLSFPSAKDSGYNSRCPGKSSACILTEGRAEYFGEVGEHGRRGERYEEVKNRYKIALLGTFERYYPHLKDKVVYVDVGTPWSNEFYLGRQGSYGLDHDTERFLDPTLTIAPPQIKNLYLTGQDYLCCGIITQPIVSWFTLYRVLGGVSSLDFILLTGDLFAAVLRRTLFAAESTHPGARELCRWLFC